MRKDTGARLLSLDLFRGLTIVGMILVNNPGNATSYRALEHAEWNGWTPTDLVFPFFLFIVGVSLVFSFASRLSRGADRAELVRHALWRSALIFAIGIALNAFPFYDFMPLRVPGVLQRIALAYAFAALIALYTRTRGVVVATVALLVGYWVLMRFVPVPGFGMPGRDIPFLDPDRNLGAWLDRIVIPGRLYEVTRDPEGLLSTLPSIATVLLGVLSGKWLRSQLTAGKKALGLLGFGIAGLALGKAMSVLMPINKKLWTSSFAVFTAGFALVVLAVCYWLVDVKGWRGWWTTPFVAFGMNALGLYAFATMVARTLNRIHLQYEGERINLHEYINVRFYEPLASPQMASLLYSLSFIVFCGVLVYLMYRKRVFLKV